MSSNDIVKYLTQEFVRYIDTPKENRKKKQKESWDSRWFGMIPMALKVFLAGRKFNYSKKTLNFLGRIRASANACELRQSYFSLTALAKFYLGKWR
jgi:hypothetical protein